MQPVNRPDWEPGSDAATPRQTPWLRSALPYLAPCTASASAFAFALLPCEDKWAVESEIDLEPVEQGTARPSRGVREGRGSGGERRGEEGL